MPAEPLAHLAVHLRPVDNLAVAARQLAAGLVVEHKGRTITLTERIGLGHKLALCPIRAGEAVYKYGQIIGFASQDIAPGELIHEHNLSAGAFERDYAYCIDCPPPPAQAEPRYWQGYDRGDGRYGTRNYIAIISTVNCSASTSKYISERFRAQDLLARLSACRRRGRADAQGGLRHAIRRARPSSARSHAGRVRSASQCGRLYPRRAGLRNRASDSPDRGPRSGPTRRHPRQAAGADDSAVRGHRQDRRRRRPGSGRIAAPGQRRVAALRCRPAG